MPLFRIMVLIPLNSTFQDNSEQQFVMEFWCYSQIYLGHKMTIVMSDNCIMTHGVVKSSARYPCTHTAVMPSSHPSLLLLSLLMPFPICFVLNVNHLLQVFTDVFLPLGKNNLSSPSLLSLLFLCANLTMLPRQVSNLEFVGSPCLTSLVAMTLDAYHRLDYAFY